MRTQRASLRNNGVQLSPRELVQVVTALVESRRQSHRQLASRIVRETPFGRQLRLILLLERQKQTCGQIQTRLGSSRRTVFRYLVRLDELGVKLGIDDSLYSIVSVEKDLRELLRQIRRRFPAL